MISLLCLAGRTGGADFKIPFVRIFRTTPLYKRYSMLGDAIRLCCPEDISTHLAMMMEYMDCQCSLWGSNDVTAFFKAIS